MDNRVNSLWHPGIWALCHRFLINIIQSLCPAPALSLSLSKWTAPYKGGLVFFQSPFDLFYHLLTVQPIYRNQVSLFSFCKLSSIITFVINWNEKLSWGRCPLTPLQSPGLSPGCLKILELPLRLHLCDGARGRAAVIVAMRSHSSSQSFFFTTSYHHSFFWQSLAIRFTVDTAFTLSVP